jgi:sRNA-binding protein
MLLAQLYPACFAVYEARRRPLKVGIRDDIIAKCPSGEFLNHVNQL